MAPFDPVFRTGTINGVDAVYFDGRWHALPQGGDGPVDDQNPATNPPAGDPPAAPPAGDDQTPAGQLPDDLNVVDEAQLRETYATLESQIGEAADSATTPEDVAALTQMRELADRIYAEINRRIEQAAQVAAQVDDIRNRPLEPLPDSTAPPPADDDANRPDLVGANQATAAQLAAARTAQADTTQQPPTQTPRPRAVLLAAAGSENVANGHPIEYSELGEAFDRIKTQIGGDAILASLPAFEADTEGLPELLRMDNGPERNGVLIREAVADLRDRNAGRQPSRQGAICEPFEIIRDIPDAFSTAEPVRAIFPSRPAGRLGFQFMQSIDLSAVSAAVALWTDAQQAAVNIDNAATLKPCVMVDCPPIDTLKAQPVTACLTFPLDTEMSNPERIGNFTNALGAMTARIKEGRILQRVDALSHAWQFHGDYGALPAVIEALNTVLAQLEFSNRLEEGQYTLIVPPGALEVLTIDRANRAYGVEAETSDVMAYIKGNVEGLGGVVESMDSSLGGEPGLPFQALTPIDGEPSSTPVTVPYLSGNTFRFRLVAPEAAIYAETGQLNVGLTRDSRLIRANLTQYFAEEWFMLGKHGPQPWGTVDVTLCADGSRAGFVAPIGCAHS